MWQLPLGGGRERDGKEGAGGKGHVWLYVLSGIGRLFALGLSC